MQKSFILPTAIILLIVAISACNTETQSRTPFPTEPLPPLPTKTLLPPLPTLTPELLTERLGHVRLSGTNELAGYAYRAFLQIPSGMVWGPDGFLYIADWTGHHIVRVAKDGTMDDLPFWKKVPALQDEGPYGIAFDSKGNLYINNIHTIYRIDANENITEFNDVYGNPVGGIAISATDELYYTDRSEKGNLYRLLPDGRSETVAFNIPFANSLVFGLDGTLYLTQLGSGRILKIDVGTGKVSNFKEDACSLRGDPCFLAVDPEGDIWVRGFEILRQFAPDGTEKPFFVDGNQYPGGPIGWHTSAGIAIDDEGNLWIASYNSLLAKLVSQNPGQPDPEFTRQVISTGFYAMSLDIGPGGEIYAADLHSESLLRLGPDGQIEVVIEHGAAGPVAVTVDETGKIFLGMPNGVIYTLEEDGSTPKYAPIMTHRMVFGADGALYAVAINPGQPTAIVRITEANTYTTIATKIDGISLGQGEAHISPARDTGLYVYTETERNLFFVDFTGKGSLIANLKELGGPGEVVMTASPFTGDIFIIPHGPYKLYRISPDGSSIKEIATQVYGDPWAMVVSDDGKWLYVSESGALDKIPISP